ncbi:hypothetical protein, partial [Morganella morganii]|uniref:hypothetical protein n=1 Tax=Morganella morganii TaxID=582 RepID=UPI001BD937BF
LKNNNAIFNPAIAPAVMIEPKARINPDKNLPHREQIPVIPVVFKLTDRCGVNIMPPDESAESFAGI